MLVVVSERVPEGKNKLGRVSTIRNHMREADRSEALLAVQCALPNIFFSTFHKQRDQYRHKE